MRGDEVDRRAVLGEPLPGTQAIEVADTAGDVVTTIPHPASGAFVPLDC